tara:strand:- start:18247 stop:18885 length:639 start_codon:yes stop_codon:yes gene_type:complete
MQNNSNIVASVHKSREILVELFKTQGYDTSDYENTTLTETNVKYNNEQLDMLFDKPSQESSSITKTYVNYYLGKSLRPPYIQEIVDELFSMEEVLTKDDTLVIIIKEDPHDTITNFIKQMWEKDGYFVILHNIKRLQFNILSHTLVPPHRLMKENEVDELKRKFNLKSLRDLPDISRFDPVVKAIGLRPGQVCEIIRPSKTSIHGYYYRVCV